MRQIDKNKNKNNNKNNSSNSLVFGRWPQSKISLHEISLKFFFSKTLTEPISFENTPRVQTVEEGTEQFTLACVVAGNPLPEISWNVRGQLIRGGGQKYAVTPEGLVIYNVTKADQGNYKCKATQLEEGVSDFKDLVIQLKVQRE